MATAYLGKRHLKIDICRVVTTLRLSRHLEVCFQLDRKERRLSKWRELKNCYFMLTLLSKLQIWYFHVDVLQRTGRDYSGDEFVQLNLLNIIRNNRKTELVQTILKLSLAMNDSLLNAPVVFKTSLR